MGMRLKKGGVMKRREFIRHAAGGMGAAALLGSAGLAAKRRLLASLGMTREERLAALPALPRKFAANETVTIGKTGIQTSLLAMGTGTVGVGQSDSADQDLGSRCSDGAGGHRAISQRAGDGLHRYLLDALLDGGRLDGAVPRRDGRNGRSQAEGDDSGAWVLVPLD